eukprot:gnl/Chilomastix_cuspidata/3369.p1 GENE.gnl/Chilomastix_cuspidata/3369~~gnl/Chilomastix_cuspidata/3369.p1  ORF type:complete len:1021 (-),score=256.61 gnl/Chilomastix_cuspidata/3369:383-3445(-)
MPPQLRMRYRIVCHLKPPFLTRSFVWMKLPTAIRRAGHRVLQIIQTTIFVLRLILALLLLLSVFSVKLQTLVQQSITEVTCPTSSCHTVVVGGGISGLIAGISALEGCKHVTIFEKRDKLGGTANFGPQDFHSYIALFGSLSDTARFRSLPASPRHAPPVPNGLGEDAEVSSPPGSSSTVLEWLHELGTAARGTLAPVLDEDMLVLLERHGAAGCLERLVEELILDAQEVAECLVTSLERAFLQRGGAIRLGHMVTGVVPWSDPRVLARCPADADRKDYPHTAFGIEYISSGAHRGVKRVEAAAAVVLAVGDGADDTARLMGGYYGVRSFRGRSRDAPGALLSGLQAAGSSASNKIGFPDSHYTLDLSLSPRASAVGNGVPLSRLMAAAASPFLPRRPTPAAYSPVLFSLDGRTLPLRTPLAFEADVSLLKDGVFAVFPEYRSAAALHSLLVAVPCPGAASSDVWDRVLHRMGAPPCSDSVQAAIEAAGVGALLAAESVPRRIEEAMRHFQLGQTEVIHISDAFKELPDAPAPAAEAAGELAGPLMRSAAGNLSHSEPGALDAGPRVVVLWAKLMVERATDTPPTDFWLRPVLQGSLVRNVFLAGSAASGSILSPTAAAPSMQVPAHVSRDLLYGAAKVQAALGSAALAGRMAGATVFAAGGAGLGYSGPRGAARAVFPVPGDIAECREVAGRVAAFSSCLCSISYPPGSVSGGRVHDTIDDYNIKLTGAPMQAAALDAAMCFVNAARRLDRVLRIQQQELGWFPTERILPTEFHAWHTGLSARPDPSAREDVRDDHALHLYVRPQATSSLVSFLKLARQFELPVHPFSPCSAPPSRPLSPGTLGVDVSGLAAVVWVSSEYVVASSTAPLAFVLSQATGWPEAGAIVDLCDALSDALGGLSGCSGSQVTVGDLLAHFRAPPLMDALSSFVLVSGEGEVRSVARDLDRADITSEWWSLPVGSAHALGLLVEATFSRELLARAVREFGDGSCAWRPRRVEFARPLQPRNNLQTVFGSQSFIT